MKIKGFASLLVAIIIVVGFILWIPALKWFLLGSVAIAAIVVIILRLWYARRPIKGPDEGVRLHLND